MSPLRKRLQEELELRGYSKSTASSYTMCGRVLSRFYNRSPAALSSEEVRQFLLHLLHERKVASSTFNVYCYALRFLYREVLGREELWPKIPFQRRKRRLPVIPSRSEVAALLVSASNITDSIVFCGS